MASANVFQQLLQPPRSVVDYSNDYAKADALQNQNALQSLSLRQAASVDQQKNALRALVQSGQIDLADPAGQSKALTAAPDVAPALLKTVQEGKTSAALAMKDTAQAGNFTATAAKTTQETQIAAHQQHLQQLSSVNTLQDAMQWVVDGVRSGTLPSQGLEPALQRLQTAAASPEAFAQWKQQTAASGLTVQQQLEMTNAKPTEVRLGNVVKTIDMNPRSQTFGKEVVPQQAIGVSPDTQANNARIASDNAASRSITIRGQDLTDARSREGLSQGRVPAGYRQNPDGSLSAIPGGPADSSVQTKPLNDTQAKALQFGSRMQVAGETLDALEKQGKTTSTPGARAGFGIGTAVNLVNSPEGQKLDQAKRDFVNAVLRRESGAAISQSEFDNAEKQYFPQIGDSPQVIAQKRANRQLATQGIIAEVPNGDTLIKNVRAKAGGAAASAPKTVNFSDLK